MLTKKKKKRQANKSYFWGFFQFKDTPLLQTLIVWAMQPSSWAHGNHEEGGGNQKTGMGHICAKFQVHHIIPTPWSMALEFNSFIKGNIFFPTSIQQSVSFRWVSKTPVTEHTLHKYFKTHTFRRLVFTMNSRARCWIGAGSRGRSTMLLSRGSPGTIAQWSNTDKQNACPWVWYRKSVSKPNDSITGKNAWNCARRDFNILVCLSMAMIQDSLPIMVIKRQGMHHQ